jgi:regulatory protein
VSESNGGEVERLAPVIPLFAPDEPRAGRRSTGESPNGASRASAWTNTWSSESARAGGLSAGPSGSASADAADGGVDEADEVAAAEAALVRRLRGRQLSVSEARVFLRERDVTDVAAETVIARCLDFGYLDDARLAEQLVHAAVSRKGQGRHAVALALSKRGIGRDDSDAAMAVLPDDEQERAADFAATRARQMRDVDRDVALRRLAGQLARRGFSSSVAMSAARAALDAAR